MSLFDFFFPEQAQAAHLRSLAQSVRTQQMMARSREIASFHEERRRNFQKGRAEDRVAKLEEELAQSALVIESLISLLEEKNVFSRQDLQMRVAQIDAADGVVDGRITRTEAAEGVVDARIAPPDAKPRALEPRPPKWGSQGS